MDFQNQKDKLIKSAIFFYTHTYLPHILYFRSIMNSIPKFTFLSIMYISLYNNTLQRLMPPNFNKSKQNRAIDLKKRFHFDPKTQQTKPRPTTKQKISEIIIKDQNGQFSSVKQQNDFNDSSWLAKLVNGLEECENLSGRPLFEISNLMSVASEQAKKKMANFENNFTIERKNEEERPRIMSRKSVPTIPSYRCRRASKQNNKPVSPVNVTPQSQSKTQTLVYNTKNNSENSSKNATSKNIKDISTKPKKSTPNYKQSKSLPKQKSKQNISTQQNRVATKENHKNSLINYSSIKEEDEAIVDMNEQQKEEQEAIIIDLDSISLKTEDASRETIPVQNKTKNKIREEIMRLSATKQKEKLRKKSIIEQNTFSKENNSKLDKSKTQKAIQTSKLQSSKTNECNKENYVSNTMKTNDFHHIYNISTLENSHQNANQQKSLNKEVEKSVNQQMVNSKILLPFKMQSLGRKNGAMEELSSYNEFLDTFKQQMLVTPCNSMKQVQQKLIQAPKIIEVPKAAPKIGGIKKNNLAKLQQKQTQPKSQQNEKVSKIQIKQIKNMVSAGGQSRIPTFSQRPTESEVEVISKQTTITDRIISRQNSLKKMIKQRLKYEENMAKKAYKQFENSSASTIKKGIQNNPKNQPVHLNFQYNHQQTIESPKFNYYKSIPIRHQELGTPPSSQNLRRKVKYEQIFKKLDINNEFIIHKYNCKEEMLGVEEKYEIGSIISKIKYLDHKYNQNEFINECTKLENIQKEQKICENNIRNGYIARKMPNEKKYVYQINKNYDHSQQMNSTSKIQVNEVRKIAQENNENIYKGNSISETKNQKHLVFQKGKSYTNQKSKKTQQIKHKKYQMDYSKEYAPLFPESSSPLSEVVEPQIKTYSHSTPLQQDKEKETGDIGSIIDSLNIKLSNYIQTNNLEDTYRKFKLQFVQLKRNMPY